MHLDVYTGFLISPPSVQTFDLLSTGKNGEPRTHVKEEKEDRRKGGILGTCYAAVDQK